VNELVIRLNLEAMKAMVEGHEIVFDCEGVRVCMRCDDATVESFQESVQKALLHMLPVDGRMH